MYYLGWYDDSKKRSVQEKIGEACGVYVEKYGRVPDVVLLSATDKVDMADMVVLVEPYMRQNYFYVGVMEAVTE